MCRGAIGRGVVRAQLHPLSLAPCATITVVRRSNVVILFGAATSVFIVTLLIADANHVPEWEQDVVRWFVSAPDWVAAMLWPIMQLGTLLIGVVAVGLVATVAFGLRRGVTVIASGVLAWFLARVVKDVVERGRPVEF